MTEHRADDTEGAYYRHLRRPITGNEVRVGSGVISSLTLRGTMIIVVIGVIGAMLMNLYTAERMSREHSQVSSIITDSLRSLVRDVRFQTCINSMTFEERTALRNARDFRVAAGAFCPWLSADY